MFHAIITRSTRIACLLMLNLLAPPGLSTVRGGVKRWRLEGN
jgi:hypothetical protein